MEQVIKFEYGFQSVNGIIKKAYFLHEIPNIESKCDCWNVLPIVYVRQFTGLLDKHGKEIYCGDKLQKIYEDACEEGGFGKTIVEVAFKDGAFGWIGEITGNFHPFSVEPFEDSEIIGNIHQEINQL